MEPETECIWKTSFALGRSFLQHLHLFVWSLTCLFKTMELLPLGDNIVKLGFLHLFDRSGEKIAYFIYIKQH